MQEIKNILVPVDFSDSATKLLRAAIYMAGKLHARVDIVFVVEGLQAYSGFAIPHMSLENMERELLDGAERKMEHFLADHMDESISHTAKILKGDIAAQITQYAAKAKTDLIVIATQSYRGLGRAIFGSVAERVLKTAPCPVMTINPFQ